MNEETAMTAWHLAPDDLRRYARGAAPPTAAASAEAHLLRCALCREALASAVGTGRPGPIGDAEAAEPIWDVRRVRAIWEAVADRVDAPRRRWPERVLVRLGVGETTARLVAATPSLRGPWLLAVAAVLALAAGAAQADERFLRVFLVVAPLGPLAGVALAFAGGLDPTREIGLATPYPGLRLLLIRTAAVSAVTAPIVAAAGFALPGPKWPAVAWLLPAAGLTFAALALTARIAPVVAVGVVASAWVLLTAPAALAGHTGLTSGAAAQLVWLAVAAGGAAGLAVTRDTVTIRLGRSA